MNDYDNEGDSVKSRLRNGSPFFYSLLERMAEIHDKKSADYASNDNPYGNYLFAGEMSKIFDNPDDAGFLSRIAEKIYRLANLENPLIKGISKIPQNESIEDTETDICVITLLWMACRRETRLNESNVWIGGAAGGGKTDLLNKKAKDTMREAGFGGQIYKDPVFNQQKSVVMGKTNLSPEVEHALDTLIQYLELKIT